MGSPKQKNEGRLVQKFEYALNLTIEKYISYIKFSLLKEKFCQIHEKDQVCLKRIHHQLQMHLKTEMKLKAFELSAEHKVLCLLNTFEKILDWVQKSYADEVIWSELSNSGMDTKHNHLTKVEYKDKLKLYLQKLSSENNAAENIMIKNHNEILDLKDCIVDLNKAVCELLDDLIHISSCKLKKSPSKTNLDDSDT
ncbi:uncharacterized protein LOC129957140 [Argiope bruennichi]|uniref:uncharacterized protein LOC129957140 n=1 Tax=Argiope bruennichi TaxID=94029 RepID=UPI0024953147|nr:uncharacterized protein LOC129957140 [Argiope bruennichi]